MLEIYPYIRTRYEILGERERERERERDRERERSRERSRGRSRSEADARKDKEQEDEAREKKRLEKKAREKEAAYQERLRNWESRERRKAKEYEKERERERCREEEREKEAKRLKEFLEDYDDERDDHKYYKGKELQRRLGLRVREAEADARERAREAEELEALRARVWGSRPPDDPGARAAYERARAALDAQYRPRLLIDVSLQHDQQRAQELQRAERREEARREARERAARERERYLRLAAVRQLPREASPIESSSSGAASPAAAASPPLSPAASPPRTPPRRHARRASPPSSDPGTTPPQPPTPPHHTVTSTGSSPITISFKNHHKLSPSANDTPNESGRVRRVHAAFAGDDDEPTGGPPHGGHPPSHGAPPSHATPTGGHTHDQPRPKEKKDKSKKGSSGAANAEAAAGDKENRSAEEKRKHIKSLIDKIPTQKDQLFQYKLDTAQIDNVLMEKKIRPWINKKIIEYIGEPEPTLVDFICSKVVAGSAPQGILDDVQMVLDEEAEVFVVKMWRLLIYELEAKRAGLHK